MILNIDGIFNLAKNKGSLKIKFIFGFVIIILVVSLINITSYLVLKSSIGKLNDVVHTTILANGITNNVNLALEKLTEYITKKNDSDKEKILNYLDLIDVNIASLEKSVTDYSGKSFMDSIKGFNTGFRVNVENAIKSTDNNDLLTKTLKTRSDATKIMEYMKKTVNELIAIELNNNSSLMTSLNTQTRLTGIMILLAIMTIGLLSILSTMILSRYNIMKERNEAIAALGASEEKFNKAFHYSADVISIVRLRDRQYIEINDACSRIFGYKREDFIGKTTDEFNLWENQEQRLYMYKVLEEEGSFRNMETALHTKYGDIRVGVTSGEIVEIGDEPCILVVWNDITERKEAEEALQRAHNELENKVKERTSQLQETLSQLEKQNERIKSTQLQLVQSEKMAGLGTMVAGVAHEINNPINYLNLCSTTLKKDIENFRKELMYIMDSNDEEINNYFDTIFTKFQQSLKYILEGSNRIKTIVQDLRMFSRLDEAEKKEILISETLESTLRLVKTQYNKQIEFVTDYKTGGSLECYPAQLNQVFLNIIINACQAIVKNQKYSDDDNIGEVRIQLWDNGKEIVIAFKDNGCGMTEEVKEKMFEPFFTAKPVGQGTGLGMSISYGIIEKHNGKLEVESEPGKGTTITVFLPHS